jgi:ABC-type cobalt transport system substrate-binding protein
LLYPPWFSLFYCHGVFSKLYSLRFFDYRQNADFSTFQWNYLQTKNDEIRQGGSHALASVSCFGFERIKFRTLIFSSLWEKDSGEPSLVVWTVTWLTGMFSGADERLLMTIEYLAGIYGNLFQPFMSKSSGLSSGLSVTKSAFGLILARGGSANARLMTTNCVPFGGLPRMPECTEPSSVFCC